MKKLLLLFITALILRAGYVLIFPQAPVTGDACQYDDIAWNVASSGCFALEPGLPTPCRAPLYPFMLSAVYFIFGKSYVIARLLQALLGALTCIVFYNTVREMYEEKVAAISSWILALYPVLIVYTGLILSETLFIFLLAASLMFLARSVKREGLRDIMLSGLFLGLSALARPTTMLFPMAVLIVLIVGRSRNIVRKFAVFLLVFAAVIAPWTARNYRAFGVFMPVSTGGGINLYCTGRMISGAGWSDGIEEIRKKWAVFQEQYKGKLDPNIQFDNDLKAEGFRMIKNDIPGYVRLTVRRTVPFWVSSHSAVFGVEKPIKEYLAAKQYFPVVFRLVLLFLHGLAFFAGLIAMAVTYKEYEKWIIPFLMVGYFSMHILFDSICNRFALPAYPYIFIMVVVLALKMVERFRGAAKSILHKG